MRARGALSPCMLDSLTQFIQRRPVGRLVHALLVQWGCSRKPAHISWDVGCGRRVSRAPRCGALPHSRISGALSAVYGGTVHPRKRTFISRSEWQRCASGCPFMADYLGPAACRPPHEVSDSAVPHAAPGGGVKVIPVRTTDALAVRSDRFRWTRAAQGGRRGFNQIVRADAQACGIDHFWQRTLRARGVTIQRRRHRRESRRTRPRHHQTYYNPLHGSLHARAASSLCPSQGAVHTFN